MRDGAVVAPEPDITTTNVNGTTIRSWIDGEWRILHVKAASAVATVSLRDHEAWRVARGLSPELAKEMDRLGRRLSEAQAALWTFQNMPVEPATLRAIADEWECGADCENGHRENDTNAFICSKDGNGCRWVEAEGLRQMAQAIETRIEINTVKGSQMSSKDRISELEDRLERLQADFNDCNAERERWKKRAQDAETK